MPEDVARADADWLALREPADAAARSVDLVDALRPHLPTDDLIVHDLGCGTGSMGRWLAPHLPGTQHWVGYERDESLLADAGATPPSSSLDGVRVTTSTRLRDITRLPAADLEDASLITASALLDMMTTDEIDRVVASIATAGCPALITLSVVGLVDLTPAHPFDQQVAAAFNAHQTRDTGHGPLTGPDGVSVAAHGLQEAGYAVTLAPSPWRLGSANAPLLTAWLEGWVNAAGEQEPALGVDAPDYVRWRMSQLAEGALAVTVQHRDLLALPPARQG